MLLGPSCEFWSVQPAPSELRITSPGAMALAATGDPELANLCSFATAREMKLAGINWAYSPVADVNSDHRNPVIGKLAQFT